MKKTVDDYELAVLQSLGRIECMLKVLIEMGSNQTSANKIYREIIDAIDKIITKDKVYMEEN